MYQGHFPPLGHLEVLQSPPTAFFDREGREIDLRVYGDGPVDAEFAAVVSMYRTFDPRFRTLGIPPVTADDIREW